MTPGKYGFGQVPAPLTLFPFSTSPHLYAPSDYNGGPDAAAVTPAPLQVPGGSQTVPFQTTPYFPPTYSNGSAAELTNHAGGYNPIFQTPGAKNNRILPVADLAALLRNQDSGSEALTANLLQLLPSNFSASDPQSQRRRGLLTPYSFDLVRPAMTPYLFDTNNPTIYGYGVDYTKPNATYPFGQAAYPSGQPIPYPDVSNRNQVPAAPLNDFDTTTWRSSVAKFGKIDLNRPLASYQGNTFHQAELDRQNLAKDIFNRLCWATGAASAFTSGTTLAPTTGNPQFEASRYLAKLAANMVDYLDGDDFNTVFIWNPVNPSNADPWTDAGNFAAPVSNQIVFGTEPPKLVLNEVYVQYDNIATDSGMSGPSQAN